MAFTDTHKYNELWDQFRKEEGKRLDDALANALIKRYFPEAAPGSITTLPYEGLRRLLHEVWISGKYD